MFKTNRVDNVNRVNRLANTLLLELLNSQDLSQPYCRFFDLLRKVEAEAVALALREMYGMEYVHSYMGVFDRLLKMNPPSPAPGDEILILVVTCEIISNTPENGEYLDYDVSGFKQDDLEAFYFYSICLTPWAEWLRYAVVEENVAEIGRACFVAACLFEMTFHGFEEASIAAFGDTLLRYKEDYMRRKPSTRVRKRR